MKEEKRQHKNIFAQIKHYHDERETQLVLEKPGLISNIYPLMSQISSKNKLNVQQ